MSSRDNPARGKSQLAVQFLSSTGKKFAWLQLAADDGDPVLLLLELLDTLRHALPEFHAPQVEDWLAQKGPLPLQVSQLAEFLLEDLENHLVNEFFLVLDDLHLLNGRLQSQSVLTTLLTAPRQKLQLLLISRQPVFPALLGKHPPPPAVILRNDDISLNRQEIATLFNDCLNIAVSSATVNDLFQANGGWIMGLLLASRQKAGPRLWGISKKALGPDTFLSYFSEEILDNLPRQLQTTLMRLSLLDEIPAGLATIIGKDPAIQEELVLLENQNFFVRSLDPQRTVFSYHHLFRDCLTTLAKNSLSDQEIKKVWMQAGQWYAPTTAEIALGYFLRAADFNAAQDVLSEIGMDLLASNRLVTLQSLLAPIATQVYPYFPWLAFYNGVILLDSTPPTARSFFELALEGFVREGNETGELLALVQLVYFHSAVDCQFESGRQRLERGIALYEKRRHVLDVMQQAHAANVFVIGLTLFSVDLERTRPFADFGLAEAKQLNSKGLEAEARMARCYRDLFAGDLTACRREVEQSLPLLQSPQVSLVNKAALQLAQLNLLINEGRRADFEFHRRRYLKRYGEELIENSSFGAIIRMWQLDLALAGGDDPGMQEILQAALDSDFGSTLPHMRSLYLQYQAYSMARLNCADEALQALRESLRLRQQAGGLDFIAMNNLLLAATWTRLGKYREALELLREALDISINSGEIFIRPGLHAYRAWTYLQQEKQQLAAREITKMANCLFASGFQSFYGWDPEVMTDLLAEAARQKLALEPLGTLSASRLRRVFLEDGRPLHQLTINCLGTLEISCHGRHLSHMDLSPSMRQLLALLIVAPKHQMLLEDIQGELWPDSPSLRSRSSFDNLISRLRKLLDKILLSPSAKDYLTLQNGVLCLENCHFDFIDFTSKIRQGIRHVRKKELWQADLAFAAALTLWQGGFLQGIHLNDQGHLKAQDLLLLNLEGSQLWFDLLVESGHPDEAITVANRALLVEPTHEVLVRKLYNLHTHFAQRVPAKKVLQRYARALEADGFTAQEREHILESFWGASDLAGQTTNGYFSERVRSTEA